MSSAGAAKTWVAKSETLCYALNVLLQRRTHPHFIGYLYLYRCSASNGSLTSIQANWPELGEYLRVDGGPEPHLRPFWSRRRTAQQEWLNHNIAGSFAPSSLRSDGPFRKVVNLNDDGTFSLRQDHAKLALRYLLLERKMDAACLSLFLHRNRGYISEGPPTHLDVVSCFRRDFGYSSSKDRDFQSLYSVEGSYQDHGWFEEWDDPEI